jgi:tRNA 2-thiouridine synthesizing protein A
MSATAPATETRTAELLIRDLQRLAGAACPACGGTLNHRLVLMSIALGFKDSPRCLTCLSTALDGDLAQLREQLYHYIQRQDCFREAWGWACREEGVKPNEMPALSDRRAKVPHRPDKTAPLPAASDLSVVRDEWDAGDLGCGELVLELRLRLQALSPGDIFKLCARDPGAPEDLPAWCRLTGHQLVRAEPPAYWIKRKN